MAAWKPLAIIMVDAIADEFRPKLMSTPAETHVDIGRYSCRHRPMRMGKDSQPGDQSVSRTNDDDRNAR